MEIKVLGSSSKGNAYHVTDGVTPLLLECGLPFRKLQQGLNFQLSSISGMLLSHSHKDHSKSVQDLLKAGIDVYMARQTAEEIGVSGHRVHIVEPLKQFTLGSWTVLGFPLQHDVTNLGYLLANKKGEKLVYITDSYYCKYVFPGLTHIMIEANYSIDILQANVDAKIVPLELKNRVLKSHFSIANVKEFLLSNDLSRVQQIHLIHLSEGNSDAERFKREVSEITGKPVYIAGE